MAYADIPEGQIHYRIEGSGEPILLLHAGVTSCDEYKNVIPFLSQNYCAIAPDFPGNGNSDPPPYPYQILDHARTMISFMDSLGIRKANVVGHHVGGKVGLELAINWPERVNKLVMSSVGYKPGADEGIVINDPFPDFTKRVEIKPDGSHLMEWWRRSACWGNPLDIVEERVIEYVKAGPRGEEIHWAGSHHDARIRFPLINCPTLVLSASQDPMCAMAESVRKLVPGGRLTIIDNSPIDVDRVKPKEFAEAVLSFLSN